MLSELSLRPPLWLDCGTQGGHIKNFLGRRYTTQNRTINVVGRCLTNVILEKVVSLRILEMLCLHFFELLKWVVAAIVFQDWKVSDCYLPSPQVKKAYDVAEWGSLRLGPSLSSHPMWFEVGLG